MSKKWLFWIFVTFLAACALSFLTACSKSSTTPTQYFEKISIGYENGKILESGKEYVNTVQISYCKENEKIVRALQSWDIEKDIPIYSDSLSFVFEENNGKYYINGTEIVFEELENGKVQLDFSACDCCRWIKSWYLNENIFK